MMNNYVQCTLLQENVVQVAWIRQTAAKLKNLVEVGKGTKDFWEVIKVGTIIRSKKAVLKRENQSRQGVFGSIK